MKRDKIQSDGCACLLRYVDGMFHDTTAGMFLDEQLIVSAFKNTKDRDFHARMSVRGA